jgi:putative glutamine amidotransferase
MTKNQPPIVGISCSTIRTNEAYNPIRYGQNRTYVRGVARAGAAPLLIPDLEDKAQLRAIYDHVDGLLLAGGEDIHPERYGEPIHEKCGRITLERDENELTLTQWAMDEGKPVLAICRGIQVLNVALGGSLYQDILAQIPGAEKHDWYPDPPRDYLAHTVTVTPGSRVASILGTTEVPVNSLHHQSLKEIAPGLTVVGHAPDGVIEAVEAGDHPFAIGVQWHPEELATNDAASQRLFDSLVQACQK